nr:alpha-2-macroglobulin-like protein 1 isoform X2 [Onthophagus taurus]
MRSLLLCKLLMLVGLVLCENETENSNTKEKFEYIFTYPQSMISEGKVTGCLTLNNAKLPAKLDVTFTKNKCNGNECKNSFDVTKDYQCFELDVPKVSESERYIQNRDALKIQLTIDGETYEKTGKEDITIFSTSSILLVETDRGRYKPEDLIKIRILALDFDMTPSIDKIISKATLLNPQRNKVKVWENITTSNGLAQLEYQLQDSAPMGYWTLNINDTAHLGFQVEAYVLPRFQTTLEHPNNFYIDDKTIDIKICAKYSYGRPVKGVGVIKAKGASYYFYRNNVEATAVSKSEELKNGCVTLHVPVKDLEINRSRHFSLDVSGSVTEQGTEETQNANGYIYMNTEPYRVYFDYSNTELKPGLPYQGTLNVKDRKVDLNGKVLKICYKHRDSWDSNATITDCQDIVMDNSEDVYFTIPPLKKFSKGQVYVEATLPKFNTNEDDEDFRRYQSSPTMYLTPSYSNSNNSIQIVDEHLPRHCGEDVTFKVFYTLNHIKQDEKITFNYMFISRYDVVKTGHVDVQAKGETFNPKNFKNIFKGEHEFIQSDDVPIGEFEIKVKLDGKIYTQAKLLVYYVTNGEVIVDEVNVDIQKCLPNMVDIKWNKETLEPAEKASLKISTGKDSLCALTGIDKASTFQSPPDEFTVDKILGPTEYGRYPYYYYEGRQCVMSKKDLEEEKKSKEEVVNDSSNGTTTVSMPYELRETVWRPITGTDASNIFQNVHVGVISNQQLTTKPCEKHTFLHHPIAFAAAGPAFTRGPEPDGIMLMSSSTPSLNREPVLTTTSVVEDALVNKESAGEGGSATNSPARTYFPETFLWDLVPANEGQTVIERTAPDSITNWVTKALCVSKSKGVGLSSTVELNVFKPFFADVLMPYSIKRNTEIMHLPVAVFNYMNHSVPVRLTLGDNDEMELVDGADKKTTSMCVEAGDSSTHIYKIKGLKIGVLNVSVTAEMDPHATENCGNEKIIVKRDLIYKTVKVEAEGYPSDIVRSALLCANDSLGTDHVTWTIDLPEGVVNDTIDGSITISSDILGPVIENLDNWLRVPSGCGEQTMAGLVPNLYILRYLKANDALTKEIEAKALKNMETGYQRILGYSHEDGSFSAFGKSDQNGSMFLTAFVVRTLRLMKEYIHIDDEVIDKAVKWMLEHQNPNGCFEFVSHVFHPMGADNDKDNQTSALTSYVAVSLKETNIEVPDEVYSKIKECISKADKSDNYTMAISSYALSLMNLPELANANIKTLLDAADVEDGKIFWQKKHTGWWFSGAQDVEVAGYGLLALLQSATPENIGHAGSVVRYLQTQVNPQGGYYSTQDSVVALDGMSRFANLVNKKQPNLDIDVSTKQNGKKNVEIRKRIRDSKVEIPLVEFPEVIEVKVKGDGCVLGQAAVKFNINEKPKVEALKLNVTAKSATKKEQCTLLEIKPCVSYNAKGHSNMALLEVSMPSGYVPDQASLLALKGSVQEVKKFELIDDKVVFYFDKLTSNEICVPFVIEETVVVENRVDSIVKLFDYYTPEISVSQSYKVPVCEGDNAIDR